MMGVDIDVSLKVCLMINQRKTASLIEATEGHGRPQYCRYCYQKTGSLSSRVAQWLRALAPAVPLETLGSRPGSVVTGRDREVRGTTHNWPSVIRVRAGRDILVSLRTSDSCGRPGAVRANQGCQVHGVSSDTLVWLASGLDARCVKKQCDLVGLCIGGCMTFNLCLSRAVREL
jgi:hypothetical protein